MGIFTYLILLGYQGKVFLNSDYIKGMAICEDTTFNGTIKYILKVLPETIRVYPTENYYYFIVPYCGNLLKGNMKFDFFYGNTYLVRIGYESYANISIINNIKIDTFKFKEWKIKQIDKLSPEGTFTNVRISIEIGDTLIDKIVSFFSLPMKYAKFPDSYKIIFNTMDESGFIFTLTYNEDINNFVWFLNDRQFIRFKINKYKGPIYFEPISGFLFAKVNKKYVLVGVPLLNVVENNWWDGPFDQLNDRSWNPQIKKYIQKVYPSLGSEVDIYLYKEDKRRVTTASYLRYYNPEEVYEEIERAIKTSNECNIASLEKIEFFDYECLKDVLSVILK